MRNRRGLRRAQRLVGTRMWCSGGVRVAERRRRGRAQYSGGGGASEGVWEMPGDLSVGKRGKGGSWLMSAGVTEHYETRQGRASRGRQGRGQRCAADGGRGRSHARERGRAPPKTRGGRRAGSAGKDRACAEVPDEAAPERGGGAAAGDGRGVGPRAGSGGGCGAIAITCNGLQAGGRWPWTGGAGGCTHLA